MQGPEDSGSTAIALSHALLMDDAEAQAAVSAMSGAPIQASERVRPLTPNNLAYLIYTSGTTGRPKGAANTHQAIVNRLDWMNYILEFSNNDVVLQKTPFSFDVSVWEIFLTLCWGAQLIIARPGAHKDSRYLISLIEEKK